MKLSIYGKFVDDDNPFAYKDAHDDYSKLTVALINQTNLMINKNGFFTSEEHVRPVNYLNEYLKYNVEDFISGLIIRFKKIRRF